MKRVQLDMFLVALAGASRGERAEIRRDLDEEHDVKSTSSVAAASSSMRGRMFLALSAIVAALGALFTCVLTLQSQWQDNTQGIGYSARPTPPDFSYSGVTIGPTVNNNDADRILSEIAINDRYAIPRIDGSWVPQLMSQRVGTVVDGSTVTDSRMILSQVEELKARYPDAVLLQSEQFPTFKYGGFWVVVVAEPSSAERANAWCDSKGIAADYCFAKLISTTPVGGPTLKLRQ